MRTIELINGGETLVDDCDYEFLSEYLWYLAPAGYVYRVEDIGFNRKKHIYMHHVLHITQKGMAIDHIDRNKLNNQKSNLRLVTRSQNMQNKLKQKNTSSQYYGVYQRGDKWVAQISKDNKTIYLGTYKHECVAALAYNKAAKKLYGENARINTW